MAQEGDDIDQGRASGLCVYDALSYKPFYEFYATYVHDTDGAYA